MYVNCSLSLTQASACDIDFLNIHSLNMLERTGILFQTVIIEHPDIAVKRIEENNTQGPMCYIVHSNFESFPANTQH